MPLSARRWRGGVDQAVAESLGFWAAVKFIVARNMPTAREFAQNSWRPFSHTRVVIVTDRTATFGAFGRKNAIDINTSIWALNPEIPEDWGMRRATPFFFMKVALAKAIVELLLVFGKLSIMYKDYGPAFQPKIFDKKTKSIRTVNKDEWVPDKLACVGRARGDSVLNLDRAWVLECRHLLRWEIIESTVDHMIQQVDVTLFDREAAARHLGYTNAASYVSQRCTEAQRAGAAARQ